MRENSERLPQKMLRTLNGTPLAAIALDIVRRAAVRYKVAACAAICPVDVRLTALARAAGIPVYERTLASRNGETCAQVYRGWDDALKDYDRVITVNPCMPFLTLDTIGQAIEAARCPHPTASVFRSRGCVWDHRHRLVIGGGLPNTKKNPEYYVLAHAFFCYPTAVLGHAAMADFRSFSILQRSLQFLDIDTPTDLAVARAWAAVRGSVRILRRDCRRFSSRERARFLPA